MCSSGGQVAKDDQALQDAQLAQTKLLNSTYATQFAEQQGVLGPLQAKLTYMAANPMGYSAPDLAAQRTSINDTTARAATKAIGAAAAFAAAHGGTDVGGGGAAQMAGEIASEAAQSKSAQLGALAASNDQLKQQNMWKALGGLQDVGSAYGSGAGTSAGASASTAGSSTNAGSGVLAAKAQGWQELGGVLGGIGSLVGAGANVAGDFGFGKGSTAGH